MNRNEEVNILIKYPPIMAVSMLFYALFGIRGVTMFHVCCDTGAGKHFRMNILASDWRKLCGCGFTRLSMGVSGLCFVYL